MGIVISKYVLVSFGKSSGEEEGVWVLLWARNWIERSLKKMTRPPKEWVAVMQTISGTDTTSEYHLRVYNNPQLEIHFHEPFMEAKASLWFHEPDPIQIKIHSEGLEFSLPWNEEIKK